MLKSTFTVHYLGYHRRPACALARVYEPVSIPGAQRLVIFQSPHPGYTGLSVTNGVERLVTTLLSHFCVSPLNTVWVEHYPGERGLDRAKHFTRAEAFDLVTFQDFERVGDFLIPHHPSWKFSTRRQVEEWIGMPFDDLTVDFTPPEPDDVWMDVFDDKPQELIAEDWRMLARTIGRWNVDDG